MLFKASPEKMVVPAPVIALALEEPVKVKVPALATVLPVTVIPLVVRAPPVMPTEVFALIAPVVTLPPETVTLF